jgi:hypothetical protein
MLTRPGSTPGSGWMRDLSERLACGPADAADSRSLPRGYWLPYIALVVMIVVIAPMMSRRIASPEVPVRESSARIIGLPLFASGLSPVAVVAVGARPRGLIAIGGVAIGVIAIGGIAVGALAFGGVSCGLAAVAGLAIAWWAVGGGAIGYRAFGGLAAGGYAYAGNGVAFGYHEASGRQKERLFG